MRWLPLLLFFLFPRTLLSQSFSPDSARLMMDVRTLSADKMKGRRTGTSGNRMAQFYILQRFREAGLLPLQGESYEYPFFFTGKSGEKIMGTNLLGRIKGRTDDIIVLSAHYDHLGTGAPVNGDSIYNGADDNASGVAGLLALAAWFKSHPPRHTLVFAAFDAEEAGLKGAQAFVQQFPQLIRQTRLNLNMDMISHNGKGELYVCGTRAFPALKPLLDGAGEDSGIRLLTGHDDPADPRNDWTRQSDQGAFFDRHIPFLYFGVEDHSDYHRQSDSFDHIHLSFFFHAVEAITRVAAKADAGLPDIKVPPREKWISGR
ncbi:M20/M25/M40 family metallo-hydrolase [Compostibacter hankyongensis]|uniref:M20/M25/M40 family metallo-hydrolase n=1 Tax=Compostibacter hankyongensis TaxID=1007089 RepID=A0ABP8FC20_9BACT